MINRFINIKLLRSNASLGVELILKTPDDYELNIVKLIRKRGGLHTENIILNLNSIAELKKYMNSVIPVLLTIKGKGILTKKIRIENNTNQQGLIGKVLPNASEKDFYIQMVPSDDSYSFISIIRKDILDGIIEKFTKERICIFDICLSYFYINNLASLLHINSRISIEADIIELENGRITALTKADKGNEDEEIAVGDENIPSTSINPYAAALSYFFQLSGAISIAPLLSYLRDEFLYKNFFRKVGLGIVSFFFFLLMLNYFLFLHFDNKVNSQMLLLKQNNGRIAKIDSLKDALQLKEKLIEESGFLYNYSFSFLADRIAYLKPEGIMLTTLNIQPYLINNNDAEKHIFKVGTLEIAGKASNSFTINEWVNKIKKEKWASNVIIIDYKNNSKENPGEFTIDITLK